MAFANLLSGRVKKVSGSDLDSDRHQFLDLKNAEPDLGLPPGDDYVLRSNTDGTRYWALGGSPVVQFTQSITLTGDWVDTGIAGADLENGTHILQLYANDVGAGGQSRKEFLSGTISWFADVVSTNPTLVSDEIILHRSGESEGATVYLRTYRSSATDEVKLQMNASYQTSSSSNYVFKFNKII